MMHSIEDIIILIYISPPSTRGSITNIEIFPKVIVEKVIKKKENSENAAARIDYFIINLYIIPRASMIQCPLMRIQKQHIIKGLFIIWCPETIIYTASIRLRFYATILFLYDPH